MFVYAHGTMYVCACRGQKLIPPSFWASFTEVEPFIESRARQLSKSSYWACPWTLPNPLYWDCRHTTTPFWLLCGWRESKLHHSQFCAVSVLFIDPSLWALRNTFNKLSCKFLIMISKGKSAFGWRNLRYNDTNSTI